MGRTVAGIGDAMNRISGTAHRLSSAGRRLAIGFSEASVCVPVRGYIGPLLGKEPESASGAFAPGGNGSKTIYFS